MTKILEEEILVTGATGQIGTRLVERLIGYCNAKITILSCNAKITILSRNPFQSSLISNLFDQNRINVIRCDLSNENDVKAVSENFKDVKLIMHLAALKLDSSNIINDATPIINSNIIATLNLIKYLPEDVSSIVFASSTAVYGLPRKYPIDENHPTNPTNIYGACKLATEKFLQIFSRENGVPVTILRYSSVYGPGKLTKRAIPSFIKSVAEGIPPTIYGDGSVMRDYVYIDDVVDATILALIKKRSGIYNIGTGEGHSIREVAEIIIELFGKNFKPRDVATNEKQMSFVYDISTARKDLGYSPKIDLREGLKRTIDYITRGR